MILSSRRCSFLPLGAVLAVLAPFGATRADEAAHFIQVDMHCSVYGPSFVDLGNGVCGPVGGRVRAQPAGHAAEGNGWTSNGTSTAALRTDGLGMVPGAGDARHLRIQSGAELYGR